MKKLTALISALFFLVMGLSHAWALPNCTGSWSTSNWKNCFGTYNWVSGDKSVGEYRDGNRSGQGTYYYLADNQWKGDKHEGEYKDNKRHGQGTYTWNDGQIWVGSWENNELSGYAITYYANGSINQEGIFKDGKFLYAQKRTANVSTLPTCPVSGYKNNCFGTYNFANGSKYVGEYKENKRHGQGTLTWANGDEYVGEYKENKKHGHGTYTFANGGKYVGEWKDDIQNGQGTDIWANGDKYVGEYKENKKHGQGTYNYANGGKYVGEWKNSEKHGQGTYTYPNGSKEVGAWRNGVLNGYAITYYADGSINQEGIFKDDKFLYAQNSKYPSCPSDQTKRYHDCFGTYVFDSGNKYVGEFKDDERNGQGTFTWVDGEKYVGEWKENKKHGQGTYTYGPNSEWAGQKYVGEYKNSKKHGQGTYTFGNGSKEVGAWENDKLNGYAITYYADGSINQEGIFKDDKFLYAQKKSSSNSQTATITCNDKPELCTVAQLCTKASHYSGGSKTWRKDYSSKKYVAEAKKNGVSCGVQVVVKKDKPVDNKTYKVASGTGFYVSNSGHIITNHHVIDGCKDMKVISKGMTIETLVLATDPSNDLALLKAKEASRTYFSISNKQPEELQDIIVAGFPFGNRISTSIKFTQGIVSSLTGVGDNYSQIQIDAALQPGNSGGPIMDSKGNIVGVAVAKLSLKKIMADYGVVPENTNFGIKASAVRNLMVGNSIVVKEPNQTDITKSQLVKLAKEGTVHLTCWMTMAQIDKAIKDETGKVLFKEFQK